MREEIILQALDLELDTNAMQNSLAVDTSIVSTEKNQSRLYDVIYDKIFDIRKMSEQDKKPRDQRVKEAGARVTERQESTRKLSVEDKGVKDIVEMYEILDNAGIIDQLGDMIKK